jgi:glycosyltransferase involved in cell wall biosynthesis
MSKKLKVVQVNRKKPSPGSIEILFSTIRKFIPNYIDVKVFVPRYESRGVFKRLAIIIESFFNQGDINHITGDIHFSSLFLNKNKTILTIHDCVSVIHSTSLKRIIIILFWYKLPLKRVQYVTTISEKSKKELLSFVNFPEERIIVIPNCVSDRFEYVEKKKINKARPIILHIGTKTNKNLIRISQALKGIPCMLDVVGELSIEQLQALEENGIDYKNSIYISENEMIQKYINADIVSFVSTYEGFGMPILEAQTVGRVVLTSNISPMIEVSGSGACLVNPLGVSDIKEGFKRLISDDNYRNEIIKKGLVNSKNYKPKKIANEYVKLYVNLSKLK